jgi:hypothetical protein
LDALRNERNPYSNTLLEGDSMKIGDLVKMKDCNLNIMGVIVHAFMGDSHLGTEEIYKIVWIDDLCDPSFATQDNLEAV